jgi:hypothetical protein
MSTPPLHIAGRRGRDERNLYSWSISSSLSLDQTPSDLGDLNPHLASSIQQVPEPVDDLGLRLPKVNKAVPRLPTASTSVGHKHKAKGASSPRNHPRMSPGNGHSRSKKAAHLGRSPSSRTQSPHELEGTKLDISNELHQPNVRLCPATPSPDVETQREFDDGALHPIDVEESLSESAVYV